MWTTPFPVAQTVRHRKECPNSPILGTTERPPQLRAPPRSHTHVGFSPFFGFSRQQCWEYSRKQRSAAKPKVFLTSQLSPGNVGRMIPSSCTNGASCRLTVTVLPLRHEGPEG